MKDRRIHVTLIMGILFLAFGGLLTLCTKDTVMSGDAAVIRVATGAAAETPTPTPTPFPTPKPSGTEMQSSGTKVVVQEDHTVAVTGLTDSSAIKLKIPDTLLIDGYEYKVSEITGDAFAGSKLQSVSMGRYIHTIGAGAFRDCTQLVRATFSPSLVNINENAFRGCKALTKALLPSGIRQIGKNCFRDCGKLAQVTIGSRGIPAKKETGKIGVSASIKISIDVSAFQNCGNLRKVIINCQVTVIGNSAFSQCVKLSAIVVYSQKLKTVGGKALKGVHDCRISVPKVKLKPYKTLFKNKGQGKRVIVAKM